MWFLYSRSRSILSCKYFTSHAKTAYYWFGIQRVFIRVPLVNTRGEKQAVLLTFDFQYIYHRWTLEKNRANLLLALELYHECQ
jgi:hypothetical protein